MSETKISGSFGKNHNKSDYARMAAVQFVARVSEGNAFSSDVLDTILTEQRLDPIDKAFASAIGKGTISYLANINAILSNKSKKPLSLIEPKIVAVLQTAVWQIFYSNQIPDHSICDESVKLAQMYSNKGAASFVNAILRSIISEKLRLESKFISEPTAFNLKCSMPSELAGYLKKWFGPERAISIAKSLHSIPSVTVRINTLKTNMPFLCKALDNMSVMYDEPSFLENAISIRSGLNKIITSSLFSEGLLTIQDEAAALVAIIADPKPGANIVDLCSAPGGKACHCAELIKNRGTIYAFDISQQRLQLVNENAARLGITIIKCLARDAENIGINDIGGSLTDMVIADVPCSGLGIIRRKPDIMINMTHERIIGLYKLQEAILNNGASLLKPGGTIIYSTCTINPMENQMRINEFIDKSNGRFEMVDFSDLIPQRLTELDPRLEESAKNGMISLYPDIHGCDGFFISKIRRIR